MCIFFDPQAQQHPTGRDWINKPRPISSTKQPRRTRSRFWHVSPKILADVLKDLRKDNQVHREAFFSGSRFFIKFKKKKNPLADQAAIPTIVDQFW
jgi:hypothetical protein